MVAELRLAGATTIEQANKVLWNFIPRYNQRFGVAPAKPGSAYRRLPTGVSLDETLCFKYLRTVANDNTVRFNGATLQILPDVNRASYARAKVEVQERLDGSIVVVHQGRTLAVEPAPPLTHVTTLGVMKPALATRRWSSNAIWMRSGWLRGSIYWVLLVLGSALLFQNHYPRFTGAPSCRFRTLTRRPPSVDSS